MKIKPIYLVIILFIGASIGFSIYFYSTSHEPYTSTRNQTEHSNNLKYTNEKYDFSIQFTNQTQSYLNNRVNLKYDSHLRPYNPLEAVIFCNTTNAEEQCNDGLVVHIFEKSECNAKNLDDDSLWWCDTHQDSSGVGRWSPEYKGGQKEALWFGNKNYSFAFVPEGEVISTFLKLAQISVSQ